MARRHRRIVNTALYHSDVTAELLKLIERERVSVRMVGSFTTGRARVLKPRGQVITSPELLLKLQVALGSAEPACEEHVGRRVRDHRAGHDHADGASRGPVRAFAPGHHEVSLRFTCCWIWAPCSRSTC